MGWEGWEGWGMGSQRGLGPLSSCLGGASFWKLPLGPPSPPPTRKLPVKVKKLTRRDLSHRVRSWEFPKNSRAPFR